MTSIELAEIDDGNVAADLGSGFPARRGGMSNTGVERRVRSIFAEINTGNYQAMIDGLAAPFEYRFLGDHPLSGRRTTTSTMDLWWQRIFRLLPKGQFTIHQVIVHGHPLNIRNARPDRISRRDRSTLQRLTNRDRGYDQPSAAPSARRRVRNSATAADGACDDDGVGLHDHLARPDQHLSPEVAASYDRSVGDRFSDEMVAPVVDVLAELAGGGVAVEFAVGTGRLAIPLAAAGVDVWGIDFSEAMIAELRKKDGAQRIPTTLGDMTTTRVCTDAALVYLVFNTIGNLRTQQLQVACFRNAAAHLRPGGCFVIENVVPDPPRVGTVSAADTIRPHELSAHHVGFDEYADRVNQILISHHYFVDGERVRTVSGAFRYVWPSELDLMAELAGLSLESRWADWHRSPFTDASPSHVSVWRKR